MNLHANIYINFGYLQVVRVRSSTYREKYTWMEIMHVRTYARTSMSKENTYSCSGIVSTSGCSRNMPQYWMDRDDDEFDTAYVRRLVAFLSQRPVSGLNVSTPSVVVSFKPKLSVCRPMHCETNIHKQTSMNPGLQNCIKYARILNKYTTRQDSNELAVPCRVRQTVASRPTLAPCRPNWPVDACGQVCMGIHARIRGGRNKKRLWKFAHKYAMIPTYISVYTLMANSLRLP